MTNSQWIRESAVMISSTMPYPIDAHRAGDVFEALLAEIRERGLYLALHLAEGVFRDADAARLSEPFEPRGDVDAVAEDVALLDDDVTEIDTNAKFDAALWRYGGVAGHHLPLHLDRTAHRVDDAGKLGEQSVAGVFDHSATVLGDLHMDLRR